MPISEALLKQCFHRFRALEVHLNDAASGGALSAEDYARRLAAMQRLGQALQELEAHRLDADAESSLSSLMDLPVLKDCSRAEQHVIAAILHQSTQGMKKLQNDSERILTYARDAQFEKAGILRTTFRLSWMRSRISWTDKHLEQVKMLRKSLETFITKLVPRTESERKEVHLVSAFQEFEAISQRISALRNQLNLEISRAHDQETWLKQYDEHRKTSSPQEPPPSPAEVLAVHDNISASLIGGAKRAEERLVIARKLSSTLNLPTSKVDTAKRQESAPQEVRATTSPKLPAKRRGRP